MSKASVTPGRIAKAPMPAQASSQKRRSSIFGGVNAAKLAKEYLWEPSADEDGEAKLIKIDINNISRTDRVHVHEIYPDSLNELM